MEAKVFNYGSHLKNRLSYIAVILCTAMVMASFCPLSAQADLTAPPTIETIAIQDASTEPQDLSQALFLSTESNLPQAQQWHPRANQEISKSQQWAQLRLENRQSHTIERILYLGDMQMVDIYHYQAGALSPDTLLAGSLRPFSQRQIIRGRILEGWGNSAQVHLSLSPGIHVLLFRLRFPSEKSIYPSIILWPTQSWQATMQREREHYLLWQGIIFGSLLILSFYHFLIFLQKREVVFLWYALYLFLTGLILMLELGVVQLFFFVEHPIILFTIKESLLLSLTVAILYFLFMRSFLDLQHFLPKLDRLVKRFLRIIIPLGYLLIILFFVTKNNWVKQIGHLLPIITLIIALICLVAIARLKDPLATYFIVGSAFLVAGVLLNTLVFLINSNGIVLSLPFHRNYLTEIGVIFEILAFSLGLGYRLRLQEQQKQRVEDINQMKSNFFANISHEFRTPLTIIMGSAAEVRGNEAEKQLIQRNSKHLLRLVNQLLDLSKLESGLLVLNENQANIIPFLRYLTESFSSTADSREIRLVFYTEEEKVVMDFDEKKIQEVIYNLLSNALKFTPKGGKVILHVRKMDFQNRQSLQITIQDNGPGIPPEEHSKVFDRFYQVGQSASTTTGSGIGLAYAKELIELMGGQISLVSKQNEGAEFTIFIPIKNEQPLAGSKLLEQIGQEVEIEEVPLSLQPDIIGRYELLLIEDNPDLVSYLENLLKKDYRIAVAKNGQKGIEMALENVPDIIISDVMMPEQDGYAVCEVLKTDERTSHIPIILLTAKATTEDKMAGLRVGADAYLTKPFNKEELFIRLEKLLALRLALQEHYAQFGLPSAKRSARPYRQLEDAFLLKLQQVVIDRLDDTRLAVGDLCQAANLSNMQVNRKLKALTGKTPSRFIRSIRLQRAYTLLQTTNLNISEIAYEVGFKNPNYFSRSFSKEFGHSPISLRK